MGVEVLLMMSILTAGEPIAYTPLSDEARGAGRLDVFETIPATTHALRLDNLRLTVQVPARCQAYDVVPLRYELAGDTGSERVAVAATAFEDQEKRAGRDLHDLALPGDLSATIEYLGSLTGVLDPSRVTRLTATSRHTVYPPFTHQPFVRSATVQRGTNLWFKFRVTNTGDTLWDPEGFGAWMTRLLVYREETDGSRTLVARPVNDVQRPLEAVYPGESAEIWSDVWTHGQSHPHVRTLPPGRFVVAFDLLYRDHREYDWIVNMWQGRPWLRMEVPIEVVDVPEPPAAQPVTPVIIELEAPRQVRMTRIYRRFEEFMTSFDIHLPEAVRAGVRDTLHVQVAPWTEAVVLKLLDSDGGIRTLAVPIEVGHESLRVAYNAENPFAFVREDGLREPWLATQMMPAMRSLTVTPYPEHTLRERLREAKDLGINVIASTAGNWHIAQIYDPHAFVGDIHAEAFKHYFDVITKEVGMPLIGWGLFPPKTRNTTGLGGHYWGETFDIPAISHGLTYSGGAELDVGHPDFPKAYAGCILFNHDRWGDQWVRTADGDLLIDVEDTWGWLRDDINVRYYLGEHSLQRFRDWCRAKYGDIETANAVWDATYASFDAVDPQVNQHDGGDAFGIRLTHTTPTYTNLAHPFHDWSPAVRDWDTFRTELRCDVYDAIQRILREQLPGAWINLRTEGAVLLAEPPAADSSAHARHLRHVLPRNALQLDVLERRGTFRYHSDYTTIPYTESELRVYLEDMRERGFRGMYLAQFDHMRDMVLNDSFGRDFRVHYGLDEPTQAIQVPVLTAAFPWWRVHYEEGHCPGVLWEDIQCDGVVTETQKREVRLFRDALDAALERASAERE